MSAPHTLDVLVVSEDPSFISAAARELRSLGGRVIGCLGPAHARCNLEYRDRCSLADHAAVVLIDSPSGGSFKYGWRTIPSGTYAEKLREAQPGCAVILCGAPEGEAGPSGEVAHATSTRSALLLLRALIKNRPAGSASAA